MPKGTLMFRRAATLLLALLWTSSFAAAQRGAEPAAPPAVPLVVGLMTVSAVHEPDEGDYETIVKIGEVSAAAVGYTVSGNVDDRRYNVARKMTREDFAHAHAWRPRYNEEDPAVFPGTTGATLSTDVLNELKTKGRASIKGSVATDPLGGLLGGLLGAAGSDARKAMGGAADVEMEAGTLTRVEAGTVPVPMIVNDVRVDLPAVHARGTLGDEAFEIFLLDNPAIPLLLRWNVGETSKRMVRISYPVERSTDPIEEKLKADGRAEIYGIYFDFAKATIRPESELVLKEIADVMARNPAWKLSVEGHTDNIGRAAANLDLSTRRAAAVRQALVDRYHVAGARLSPSGYGASRPKETNDTLEGRARNRRVELVRQ
jgi:outer membrane protein OmpA-like peptidoglycan-associated protein